MLLSTIECSVLRYTKGIHLMNGKQFLSLPVLTGLLFTWLCAPSYAMELDTKTVEKAGRVVWKYTELQQVVSACNYQDIDLAALKQEIDSQIQQKTSMSTDTFSTQILNANGDLDALVAEAKKLGCPPELTAGAFYMMESSLRRSLETLSEVQPKSAAAVKPVQPSTARVVKPSAPNYQEAFEKAHSVVIAELMPTTNIPKRYTQTFVSTNSRADYVYFLAKGWKGTAPRYVVAADFGSGSFQRTPNQSELTGQYVFFVTEQNLIFLNAPVSEVTAFLDKLGEPDWFWAAGDLIRNKK